MRKHLKPLMVTLPFIITIPLSVAAQEQISSVGTNEDWGVGIGMRSASLPYKTSGNTVNDVMPLLFYRGEYAYLEGASGGVNFYRSDNFSIGFAAQMRFFDIPRSAQNTIQGSQIDLGGKATWHYSPNLDFSLEVLSDYDSRYYSNLTSTYKLEGENWDASIYATLRSKSARFNDTYYGLQLNEIGAAIDSQVGARGRIQLYQNLYAVGHLGLTVFDHDTYSSNTIDYHTQWEGYLGVAMFGRSASSQSRLKEGAYLRLANGIATLSGPNDLLFLDNQTDPERNSMTSIFYGHPLAGSVFDWPLDFYLTSGYVYHHNSDSQSTFDEFAIAIKAYYTFDWSIRTRLGFAEGISYATQISHVESTHLTDNGYKPSKLMNYLDFSLDVNVGDVFNNTSLNNLWLGYSLHHRSGIFTTTSAFGRIKGGSDYNSLYLQWHF